MLLKSLENTPIADIVDAFNQSFADYELPLQFTQETMLQKYCLKILTSSIL